MSKRINEKRFSSIDSQIIIIFVDESTIMVDVTIIKYIISLISI